MSEGGKSMAGTADSSTEQKGSLPDKLDVVVVGAGFAGLYILHRMRGLGLSARAIEAGSGVGGTWYWNRYPGARCDTESMQYSFSFSPDLQQEWSWSERFASQPEILRYANHVADRFDLRREIVLNTRVLSAHFNEQTSRWVVTTDGGQRIEARYCIMATGCLSNARMPDFEGMASFKGQTYHTGHWPHEGVDFTGKRVAVIGTGSSAIQAIPVIAEQASRLYVFQRTPNYSIPARNAPMTADYEQDWKSQYDSRRAMARQTRNGILANFNDKSAMEVASEERQREYEKRWITGGTTFMASFNDLITNKASNDTAAEFVRNQIRAIVRDAKVAELLAPKDYPIGTKRICADTHYFETYNRENVTLVDIRNAPIERLTERGLVTGGNEYEVDAIVFATGFDAMTGTLNKIDIQGRKGEKLREKWAAGPRTYLGLMSAGFPNLFMITGPGSPSVLSNMLVSIEQHVDWLTDCLGHLQARQQNVIEPTQQAEDEWVAHVNETAAKTLYPSAASWYMGANVPGKPRVFMPYIGGVGRYRQHCAEIAAKGYEGFRISNTARDAAMA
ncbi:MAG TPA: NAD(P)/FAD-dependent oxidoreductase [Hyphomicrobiaceae bacterium]|nr:NAD(P)/FAD-dependent oxidoreductase [Hyphomicrobiaceae bacterium]